MNTWFYGDPHFGHANIIRYCRRPQLRPGDLDLQGNWVSKYIAQERVDAMDVSLTYNWNELIGQKDDVYVLGDWNFGDGNAAVRYLDQLNFGRLFFVNGNHDSGMEEVRRNLRGRYSHLQGHLFFLGDLAEVKVNEQLITLCHFAMRTWNKSHYGAWNLYGHSHGTLPDDPNMRAIDVGVDCHNYKPISFAEVEAIMARKKFVPIDHHTGKK